MRARPVLAAVASLTLGSACGTGDLGGSSGAASSTTSAAGGGTTAATTGGGGGATTTSTHAGGASSTSTTSGGAGGATITASGGAGGATITASGGAGGAAPTCGDGHCDVGESCASCLADCRPAPKLDVTATRGGDAPSFVNASTYDYSPSVVLDGVYRMWWCCGLGGDHVCYAEADSLDGPWHGRGKNQPNTFDDVFGPTGNLADFDGTHTCDPSVVRVDGTYYMFYGGIAEKPNTWTRIGVATSADGLSWTRLAGGQPIVDAARDPWAAKLPNTYGAGQPSVVWLDGLFYLVFTDTTGLASNPVNGAGQYVLRSPDPTFQSGVEELGPNGFVPYGSVAHTSRSLVETYASDWQYVDAIDGFAVAIAGAYADGIDVRLFDRGLSTALGDVKVPGHWTEEAALASRPDKHAVPWSGSCGAIAFDVMRSVGPGGPATWDIAHAGATIDTGIGCDCAPLGRMLEGTRLAVAGRPLTVVEAGTRLQLALAAPALRLARTEVDPGAAVFDALPYGASLKAGNEAWVAPGLPGAFLLDDGRLWPVSCPELVSDDGATLTPVDAATYGSKAIGPALRCLR
jgi:hypothetical protein